MKIPTAILAVVLSLALSIQGCSFSVPQFEAVLNEIGPAVLTILEIVSIFKGTPVNSALPSKINADVAGLEKLYSDFQAAQAAAKPGIQGDIASGFDVLNADLGTAFSIAQVSDPNTEAKITALIGLVQTGVGIAEAIVPAPSPAPVTAKAVVSTPLSASAIADSWNKILTAKTGNVKVDAYTKTAHRIHVHNVFTRTTTLGIAK